MGKIKQNLTSKIWAIIGSGVIIFGIVTGFITLDNKWEESPVIEAQADELKNFKIDVAKSFKQMQQQQSINWHESRLSNLYDGLRQAEYNLRKEPESTSIKDRIKYLEEEIRSLRKTIQEEKNNYNIN